MRDRPGQLKRHDRQGLALRGLLLAAGPIFLARRLVAEAQERRVGQGPCERGVAALRAAGALPLPGRCLGACDPSALGHASLAPWDAGAVMPLIHQPETQARAEARDGLEPVQGMGLRLLRRLHHGPRQVSQQLVISGEAGEGHRAACVDGGLGKPRGAPRPVGRGGALCADLGPGVRAVGWLAMRQQRSAFPQEREPAPAQSPGRPPRRGRAIRLGPHTATQQGSNVRGIHGVIVGFAPVQSLPREGRPKAKRPAVAGAQVCAPVPGEEAGDADAQIAPGGRHGFETRFGASRHVPVHQALPILGQDADVHGASMQVDAAVQGVLFRGKSPEVSSSCACWFPRLSLPQR